MKIPSFRTKEKRLRFNRAYMCVYIYIFIRVYACIRQRQYVFGRSARQRHSRSHADKKTSRRGRRAAKIRSRINVGLPLDDW